MRERETETDRETEREILNNLHAILGHDYLYF